VQRGVAGTKSHIPHLAPTNYLRSNLRSSSSSMRICLTIC
jgi:hypothetical protein